MEILFWTLQMYLQTEADSLPLTGCFPQSLLLFEVIDYRLYWTEPAWVDYSSYWWLQRHLKTFVNMMNSTNLTT